MGAVAIRGAKAVGYASAGTFEFLLASDGSFYFLEMNTRLQVEHPVTEWVTGVDLVREMVRVAAGEKLSLSQDAIVRRGASIECRVYAEDPEAGFLPSPGTIRFVEAPSGPGVRDDSAVYPGASVSQHYDPLISKLSVWGPDRPAALARLRRALAEYRIAGIRTNLAFHQRLAANADFEAGRYDTGFIAEHEEELIGSSVDRADESAVAVAIAIATASGEARAQMEKKPGRAALTPWVTSHRAGLLRKR
jgi:acetyl-CoA carboxylase biotin carboxylase subunit